MKKKPSQNCTLSQTVQPMLNSHEAIRTRLGANIRSRRIAMGMTQDAVGAAMQKPVTFQQVQKYENGKNRIAGEQLYDIALILHCRVEDLYEGIGHMLPTSAEAANALSKREIQLLTSYRSIGKTNVQDALHEMVRAMALQLVDTNFTNQR